MRLIVPLGFLSFVSLSGCATGVPRLPEEGFLPLGAVVKQINCELYAAVDDVVHNEDASWLRDWQAAYNITLKANETGSLRSFSGSFPFSLTPTALLNLGLGGSYIRTANRTALFKFTVNLADMQKENACGRPDRASIHPLVSGKIGFGEWLRTAVRAARDPTHTNATKLTSIGHTFQFATELAGDISPKLSVTPAMQTIVITPSIGIGRDEDSSVDVVFAKPEGETTKVVEKKVPALTQDQESRKQELLADRNAVQQRLQLAEQLRTLSKTDPSKTSEFEILRNQEPAMKERLSRLNREIRKIEQNPKGTRTTTRVVTVPGGAPEQNTNIANTLGDLVAERLANRLNQLGRRGLGF